MGNTLKYKIMINYTWKIKDLWTKTVDGKQDYVVNAAYEVEGVDGTFSYTVNGGQTFSVKEGSTFIPYSELTEEVVVGWIKSELGNAGILPITACIEEQIELQKNPPVVPVITPLPWANS